MLQNKGYGQVKSFCGKTNRQTDAQKTICPRSIDAGGIKKNTHTKKKRNTNKKTEDGKAYHDPIPSSLTNIT